MLSNLLFLPLFLVLLSSCFFAYFMDKSITRPRSYKVFAVLSFCFAAAGALMLWLTVYPSPLEMWGKVASFSVLALFISAMPIPPDSRNYNRFLLWVVFVTFFRVVGHVGLGLLMSCFIFS